MGRMDGEFYDCWYIQTIDEKGLKNQIGLIDYYTQQKNTSAEYGYMAKLNINDDVKYLRYRQGYFFYDSSGKIVRSISPHNYAQEEGIPFP